MLYGDVHMHNKPSKHGLMSHCKCILHIICWHFYFISSWPWIC